MPKNTQPSRLIDGCHQRCWAAAKPIAPETRKQIDPNASGRHTSRSYSGLASAVLSAWKVVTLKNSVPADWTDATHQSAFQRPGKASQDCSPPPAVNRIEPTKKVDASAFGPTRSMNPGNGPTRKHSDPRAKQKAIQNSRRAWRAGRDGTGRVAVIAGSLSA